MGTRIEEELEALLDEAGDRPLYFLAAERIADVSGTTVDAVKERDNSAAENPKYPTEQCLKPEDLDGLVAMDVRVDKGGEFQLSKDQLGQQSPESLELIEHVQNCTYCKTMLCSFEPNQNLQDDFERAIRDERHKRFHSEIDVLPWTVRNYIFAFLPLIITSALLLTVYVVTEIDLSTRYGFYFFGILFALTFFYFVTLSPVRVSHIKIGNILSQSIGAVTTASLIMGYFLNVLASTHQSNDRLALELAKERVTTIATSTLAHHQAGGDLIPPESLFKEDPLIKVVLKDGSSSSENDDVNVKDSANNDQVKSEPNKLAAKKDTQYELEVEVKGSSDKVIVKVDKGCDGGKLYVKKKDSNEKLDKVFVVGKVNGVDEDHFYLTTSSKPAETVKVGLGSSNQLPFIGTNVVVAIDHKQGASEQIQAFVHEHGYYK